MLKYVLSAFVLLATVGAAHATRYYQSREDGSYFVIPTPSTRSVPVPGRPGVPPEPGCYKELVEGYIVVVCVAPYGGKPPGTWPPEVQPPIIDPPEPPIVIPPEPPVVIPPEPPIVKDHIHKPGGPMDLSPPPSVQPVPQASRSSYIPGGKPMIRPFRQQYRSRYAR